MTVNNKDPHYYPKQHRGARPPKRTRQNATITPTQPPEPQAAWVIKLLLWCGIFLAGIIVGKHMR